MNIRMIVAALVLCAAPVLAADNAPVLMAGYRALALPFPAHQVLFVSAGDRIDVMTTFTAEMGDSKSSRKEDVTATILQNIVVLAVDRKEGVILIELNPNEAQYAALFAAKDKTLWLSKRAPGDKEMHPMEMASAKKLFR
jgi:Flp pilus assembly protein CpaB